MPGATRARSLFLFLGLAVAARSGAAGRAEPPGAAARYGIALRAVGRSATGLVRARSPLVIEASADGVRVDRAAGIVEWWRGVEGALEHGVDLATRPDGPGELVLELDVAESLTPEADGDDAILLRAAGSGRAVGRYAGLVVLDSVGARAPARLEARDGHVVVTVDDASAHYPIVVDPLISAIEEATLLPADASTNDELGWSVSLSAEGLRAIVGAPGDTTAGGAGAGSARIFVRTGTTWTAEATLLHPAGAGLDHFGQSVAISGDGSRAVIGADGDDTGAVVNTGAAIVFSRAGTVWTREATLLHAAAATGDALGYAVAISGDGTRVAAGAWTDDTMAGVDAGSVRVFFRTGTTWTEETTLLAPGALANQQLGNAVSFSTDGSRLVVGDWNFDAPGLTESGRALVFRRTSTTWTFEAALQAPDAAVMDVCGNAVALAGDGSRAIIGCALDDTTGGMDAGSARVFSRAGTSWTHETALGGGAAGENFGDTVALSSDGSLAFVGGSYASAPTRAGAVWAYQRTGTTWTVGNRFQATTRAAGDQFGISVAVTPDATRAIVGAYRADPGSTTNGGTALVFRTGLGRADGSACATGTECRNDQCADGVCCNGACGGSAPGDCEACTSALTGMPDGTCAPLSAGSVCRGSTGACDPVETCDGTGRACPANALATAGSTCRAAAGACDAPEVCDGAGAACPGDVILAVGVVCRSDAGDCDVEETCDGTSVACPADARVASGTICRPAAGPCDLSDACDGASSACPSAVAAAGTVCDATVAGDCDAPDHCDGVGVACPDDFLSGVECRGAAGACDAPELCSGGAATCPPDVVVSAGLSCRASTDPSCDPEETCDGTATSCPRDVTSCASADAGPRDAGSTAPETDGGATADAATGPPTVAPGCGCRVGASATAPGVLATLLALAIVWRRGAR